MWKKDETTPAAPMPTHEPARRIREADPAAPAPRTGPHAAAAAPAPEQAAIGPSITIRGEVTGDEDLVIQGTVEGSVDLGHHSVAVGREGRVKANITGRVVTVEGEVEGDLIAEEQVVLRPSAAVKGDITAPRVVLEDGARFRGMVEMGEAAGAGRRESSGKDVGGDKPEPEAAKVRAEKPRPEPEEPKAKGKAEPEKVGGEAR